MQSAVVAAIVTSSFSWTDISDSYWLAPALWYCSLLLAILGILISSQQIAVLDVLGLPHATGNIRKDEEESARKRILRFLPLMLSENRAGLWEPRWKMVFVWQSGIQFLGYAVTFYVIGLTIYVCSPLIQGTYGPQANVRNVSLSLRYCLDIMTNQLERVSISRGRLLRCWRLCLLRLLDLSLYRLGERHGIGKDAR